MTSATDTLGRREQSLLEEGGDPLRIEVLRRARRFKRSWIEMADALLQVKVSRKYEAWGYADLYAYCEQELLLKRRTVEKLTGSFSTIQQHAPEVLDEEREDTPVPTYDAVDYYKRVVEAPHSKDEVEELHTAVFERGEPLSEIKKQFNPIFFAKTNEDVALEALMRLRNIIERLTRALEDVEDRISETRASTVKKALASLRGDLDELIPEARERAETSRAA